jgi:hypothetical protein
VKQHPVAGLVGPVASPARADQGRPVDGARGTQPVADPVGEVLGVNVGDGQDGDLTRAVGGDVGDRGFGERVTGFGGAVRLGGDDASTWPERDGLNSPKWPRTVSWIRTASASPQAPLRVVPARPTSLD